MRIAYACVHKGMYMNMPRLNFSVLQRLALDLLMILVAWPARPECGRRVRPHRRDSRISGPRRNRSSRTRRARCRRPSGDTGVIAVPRKKESRPTPPPPPPAPAAPQFKNPEGMGNVTMHVNVPEVTLDVGVHVEKTHQFVPGLKPSISASMRMAWSKKWKASSARRRRSPP